jgi:DNA polymerase alpha subunit A
LTKDPKEYADAKSQPHVQVALRMREAGLSVNSGDTVPFVICLVENLPTGSKGFAERAFHPNDVKNGEKQLGKMGRLKNLIEYDVYKSPLFFIRY